MDKKQALLIDKAFDAAEEEFGDGKSTEFLMSIVAERLGVDHGDVAEGLAIANELNAGSAYAAQDMVGRGFSEF